MPHTWFPSDGAYRRLFIAALAALLAFTTLAIAPGAVAPAHGTTTDQPATECGTDNAECPPELSIEKSTNGHDADTVPGPSIPAGDAVVWTYDITNTGPVAVHDILVTDDDNDGATISCAGQTNGSITLEPGASIQCSASSVSWYLEHHKQHENLATVTGYVNGEPVVATDLSHYRPTVACPFGEATDRILVDILGTTGGKLLGAPSQVPNQLGPISVAIPAGVYSIGWASYDAHDIKNETNPGQTQEQWYVAVGGATSVDTDDVPWDSDYAQGVLGQSLVVAADASSITIHHGGQADTINSVFAICVAFDPLAASIDVVKTVDKAEVTSRETVEFTITVTNDGEVTLTNLVLEDVLEYNASDTDDLDQCETPDVTTLAPGESTEIKCTQELDAAVHGSQVLNTVKVTATPPAGANVTDTDSVPVTIVLPDGVLQIDKLVGPLGTAAGSSEFVEEFFVSGSYTGEVTWQVTVKNPTGYAVSNLLLDDVVAPAAIASFEAATGGPNGTTSLASGAAVTFVFNGTGVPDTVNVAGVIGIDLLGTPLARVTDDARISALGASATIGDTVWSDENANGKQDNGEKGIAGAKVRLTLPDNSTAEAVTNANGLYLFSALEAGTYKVEIIMSSIPDPAEGSLKLTTAGLFTVQLADGESYLDADFGVVATLPATGLSTDQLALIALALLLGGGFALFATRKREDASGEGTIAIYVSLDVLE